MSFEAEIARYQEAVRRYRVAVDVEQATNESHRQAEKRFDEALGEVNASREALMEAITP